MTPRSAAVVEAVAVEAYGTASSTVVLARMVGMAVDSRSSPHTVPSPSIACTIRCRHAHAYLEYIPETLRDRPLRDGLVVEALEQWAAGEAARIMVGIFLVAGVVTAVAVPPSLLLDRRRRRLAADDGRQPDPRDTPTDDVIGG